MKKKAYKLEFISRIKRDGSGTEPVSKIMKVKFAENPVFMNDIYSLTRLSITEDTYIASGFNSYVVKIKS